MTRRAGVIAPVAAAVTVVAAGAVWWGTPLLAGTGGSRPGGLVAAPDITVSSAPRTRGRDPTAAPSQTPSVSPEGAPRGASATGRGEDPERRALSALSGTLSRCGEEYCVNGVRVDFGAPWYLTGTRAPTDYDRDRATESLQREIAGLDGVEVTLTVELGRSGDVSVFAVDGVFFRSELGPAPWAGTTPPAAGERPPGAGPPTWVGRP